MSQASKTRPADRRPRVLQLVNSFHLGGAEGQVVELLRGLEPRFQAMAAALHVEGPHLETVRALGIEPHPVRLSGSLARPGTLAQIVRLALHLRRQSVALVHVHDFYSALVGTPAARLAGARVVVGRLDLSHFLSPAQRVALAAACRLAHHVVVNARAVERQIVQTERLPAGRVTVIPNGIDLADFDRRKRAGLRAPLPDLRGRVALVHVANMIHPVKAQEDLFAAMVELQRGRTPVVLLLVGDGPRRLGLERLSKQLGITDRVFFLGWRQDVPAVLARCEVGVLCSHAEGLSNAVIECMAAGLPMVVTDVGGNGELVRHGVAGYLVPPRSPRQLAERIKILAGSKPLRRRMGRAGREFVAGQLGLDKLVARHLALYGRLLGEGRPSRAPTGRRRVAGAEVPAMPSGAGDAAPPG